MKIMIGIRYSSLKEDLEHQDSKYAVNHFKVMYLVMKPVDRHLTLMKTNSKK